MSTLSQFSGGGIKSIQRGTIAVNNAVTVTATITAVNTAKTILNYCGCKSGLYYGGIFTAATAYIRLTSSTQITAAAIANHTVATVSYEVIEYF